MIPRGSVAWRVHGDVTTMMIGGMSGLLLQMLHPQALAGVWDHSNFREDMLGRLRRTARFIATTTYGERADAEAMIARVRRIHARVVGTLPDGRSYAADDPRLLAWVHVAGEMSFLEAWIRHAEPDMSRADQDRFFADVAIVAEKLGADPIPRSIAEAKALLESFRPELVADERSHIVRDIILSPPGTGLAALPVQKTLARAAVDLLPGWARRMHRLRSSGAAAPLLRASVGGLANSLRWALGRT
ncbi:oxygenase MpaB family protein [Sphingomonas piscis]|uniref:oxygenase MpaB family protein n=1 Tax=Sphingomonas piscis TaxID=2714943 RepID=UPI001FEACEC0|nr:oxygenase MpaB family protein [Sphingomonas piscis]